MKTVQVYVLYRYCSKIFKALFQYFELIYPNLTAYTRTTHYICIMLYGRSKLKAKTLHFDMFNFKLHQQLPPWPGLLKPSCRFGFLAT